MHKIEQMQNVSIAINEAIATEQVEWIADG